MSFRIDPDLRSRALHALGLIARGVSPARARQLAKHIPRNTPVPRGIPRPYSHWRGVTPLKADELDRDDVLLRTHPDEHQEMERLARQLVDLGPMSWELAVGTARTVLNQQARANLAIEDILTRAGVTSDQYGDLWFPGLIFESIEQSAERNALL